MEIKVRGYGNIPNQIKIIFYLAVILLFTSHTLAQNDNIELNENAFKNLYAHPEKTITISEYLISNSRSIEEKSAALNLKSEALIVQGKYVLALNTLLECLNLNKKSETVHGVYANLILADLYRQLGVVTKSEERIKSVKNSLKNEDWDEPNQAVINAWMYYIESASLSDQQKYTEAIEHLLKSITNSNFHEVIQKNAYIVCKSYNLLARNYLLISQPDPAATYARKSLQIAQEQDLGENFTAYARLEIYRSAFLGKDSIGYAASIHELTEFLDRTPDNVLKKNIHQFLAEVYKKRKDNKNYQRHNLQFLEFNESVNFSQQKARDLILSLAGTEREKINKDFNWINYILPITLILTLILLAGMLWYRKQTKLKYNYYKEYISNLKREPILNKAEEESIITELSKNQLIPEKTEHGLLEKLYKFEKSNEFTQKNLTLHSLAKDLETNTRYLSEIVNKHKHKNFNAYINELRINYIVEKLRTEPKFLNYKISYLAEECGFSSHTAFSTVFKTVTGISPKEFINFIKKETVVESKV